VLKTLAARVQSLLPKKLTWRRALAAIVVALSLAFLSYKAWTSWDEFKTYDWRLRAIYLVPSFALFVVQFTIITWGWRSIMNGITKPLSYRRHLKIYGYTNLMRRIPAGALWAVAGRAYSYKDHDIPARASVLGSVLELLLAILTGLPLAALAGWRLGYLGAGTGLAIAGALFVLELAALHPAILIRVVRLARPRDPTGETLPPIQLTYARTLGWAGIYCLIWLVGGLGMYLIANLFVHLPLASLPITLGVWVLSNLASYLTLFSPSGLGVKELSTAFLLGTFLADPLPLLIALALRLIWTVYDLLIGVAVLLL
jgi:hypothetical protein